MNNCDRIIENVYRATLIPITVIGSNGEVRFSTLAAGHHKTFRDLLAPLMAAYETKTEKVPFVGSVGTIALLGIYRVGNETIVQGPTLFWSNVQYHPLREAFGSTYPLERIIAFFNYLVTLPVVPLRRFTNSLGVAISMYTKEYLPIEEIVIEILLEKRPLVGEKYAEDVFKFREDEQCHISYEKEQFFFGLVEAGDLEGLKKQLQALDIGSGFGQMSANSLRQARYLFVAMLTNVTRSAIRGGVSQEYAYSLSDIYARNMDSLSEIMDIHKLACRMTVDFASRVQSARHSGEISAIIRLCLDFINKNLYEKISLQDLADRSGLSTKTISAKFREEMNCPVTEYIHREKMREAKYLLKYSGYSILDISSILGYSSQSYFIRIFKSFEDKTPLEYKEEIQRSK